MLFLGTVRVTVGVVLDVHELAHAEVDKPVPVLVLMVVLNDLFGL